ncbi:MAG: hypothetical protein ABGZ36_05275, partial [Actinomycetota bacterium]
MSDIEFRVDKAFSSAVEQQLDEQREIRRLVSRVDESLIALSDGMVDLSGQLSAATDRPDRAAVTPQDLEQARQELADHITRVSDRIGDVSRQLSERRDDGELASTLSATRADLLEAMARLERQSAPVAEAVDESRREVVAALRRISDVVDANRDEAWVEAVGRLDEVIGALRTQTADDRAATERSVEELRARAEDALASMESAAEGRLADAAERAAARLVEVAEESGDRSATAVQQASIAAERAAAAASEAAERAGEAAADAARSAAAEASTTIEQAAAAAASAAERSSTEARTAVEQAAAAASSAAERAAEESAAAAATAADRASAAATEAVQAAARAAVEASETASASAEQAVSTAADGMAVLARDLTDRSGETVEEVREIHRVIDLTAKDIAERHADVADRLAEVAQVASALPPELRGTLDDIAGRLTALVEQQRGDAAEAMERIASGRGATPEEVRTLVEDLTASMDRAVSVRFADLVDANADATEAMRRAASRLEDIAGSSAARLEDVSATSTERLHELVDAVAERTEATTSRSVDLVREATEANALRTEAAVEQAVSSLLEAQTTGSREMRTAAEALTTSAQTLEPTVGAALEDLRTALLARTDGDREQVEEAIAALAEASAAARDGVLSAVGRATARLAEAQAEGIGQLSAVTDDLGRLPEAITPPVLEAVEQMQAGVRAAIQELTEASAEATRLARADLEGRAAAAGLAVTSRHGNMCPCRACDSADTAVYRWTLAPWGFHPAENNLELRGPDFQHRPKSDVSAVIALLREHGATPVADGLWEAIWRQDHELAAAQVEVLECVRGLDQSVFLRIYEDVEWSASNGGWRRRGEHTWQLPPSASTRLLVPSTLTKGMWQLYVAARALPDEAWIDLSNDDPRTALAILRRHEVVALVDAGFLVEPSP